MPMAAGALTHKKNNMSFSSRSIGFAFTTLLAMASLSACRDTSTPRAAPTPVAKTQTCTPASADSTQHIVTAWKTAPSDAIITHPISGLSVRQSFAPHWSGETIRLRLSNRYSATPVELDRVHIARERTPGSPEVLPDSHCLLTFNGQSKVILQPGETLSSDWVSYSVKPFERVSISFYAPGLTPQVTRHLGANELIYMSIPGDHTASSRGEPYQPVPDGYTSNFLAIEALEVLSRTPVKTLVAVGDSITDGSDSTTGFLDGQGSPMTSTDQRYPDHLQRRILKAGLPIAVANAGIGGNELLNDGWLPQFGPALLKRLDADVLQTAGATHVLLMIGTNDFGNPHLGSTPTAEDAIAGFKTVIERVHAAGLKIVLGTIPPAEGTVWEGLPVLGVLPVAIPLMHGTASARQARDDTNSWIREQRLSDGIVDFEACLSDRNRPGYLAPEYNSGDNLHPSPTGYAAMADCIPLDLFSGA